MRKRRLRLIIPLLLILLLFYYGAKWIRGFFPREPQEPTVEEEASPAPREVKLSVISEIKMTKDPRDNFDEIFAGDDMVIYYEKGELRAMDLDNKVLWTRHFPPKLVLDKNVARVLVVEKERGNVYHLSTTGELLGSSLGLGEIEKAYLTQDNRTLLFLKDNRRLLVLDDYLQISGDIRVESGAIINSSVSTKSETIKILTLEEEEGELLSRLHVYSMEGRLIESRREDMLALNIYTSGKDTLIVYQNGLQFYDENLDKKGDFISTPRVSFSQMEGFNLYLVTGSSDPLEFERELELSSFSLSTRKIVFTNKISDNYDNIYSRGGVVLASFKNTLDLYDLRGELLFREVLPFPIKKAMLLDENKLAVFDGSRFTLFEIEY